MAVSDLLRLLLLAAIWGSSYLFMRVAAPGFGPLPLVTLRLAGAALFFMPWLLQARNRALIRGHVLELCCLGVLNSAVPFSLLAFASLRAEAGFNSVIGATVPLFAAAVDALWWRHPLSRQKIFGLVLGFSGVLVLAWGHIDFHSGGNGWALLAALLASLCYGIAAHYGKHHFAGQPVMLPAAGSMLAATVLIAPFGVWQWPAHAPPPHDWLAAAVLAVVCTAIAYMLYYRIITRVGATTATTVTFVIPVFGVLWGALFLHEHITATIVVGMLITLLGTAVTTGFIRAPRVHPAPAP
ncbi:MAG: EamA family transporter [Steroidobacteraceae bacterium]